MKIVDELRPDGTTRYRLQHPNPKRPGRYTTARFDDERDAKEFVRRAKVSIADALAWDAERRGGVSFRGQAGRTFYDYAVDFAQARTDVKEKTRNGTLADIRQIKKNMPHFAELQMGAITNADFKRLKRELTAHRTTRGEALKSRTKNGLLETVISVVRHAAHVGDIPRDVSLGVTKFLIDDARKPCPITVPEFDAILIHVGPARRALFRTLLDSGLRISEALSLTWADIRDAGKGIYEISVWEEDAADGKTGSAQRITTIPEETFKSIPRADDVRVFPLTYDTASLEWRRAVMKAQSPMHAAEFPPLPKSPTIHDLRHTHAGFLITLCGMNLALVAERLGHKDISVTQRFYGRLVTEQAHELGVVVARSIPRGTVS